MLPGRVKTTTTKKTGRMVRAKSIQNILIYFKLVMSQKNQWGNSCLAMVSLQQNPTTACLLANRTHGTADVGRKYMWIWQGVLKDQWEARDKPCDKLPSDSTRVSALQLLDTLLQREKWCPAVSPLEPFRARAGQLRCSQHQLHCHYGRLQS